MPANAMAIGVVALRNARIRGPLINCLGIPAARDL